MTRIETPSGPILVVPVPKASHAYRIDLDDKCWNLYGENGRIDPIMGNTTDEDEEVLYPCFLETRRSEPFRMLTILGTVTADTIDFDVEPFVENNLGQTRDGVGFFMNYVLGVYNFEDDRDSFRFLLAAHGAHLVNPLGEEPQPEDNDNFQAGLSFSLQHQQWHEAQSKVVEKVVIIKVN